MTTTTGDRSGSAVTGTGALVRLALRRDRIILPIWVYAYLIIAYANPSSIHKLYKTTQALAQAGAGIAANPTLVALSGPAANLDTLGGFSFWKFGCFAALGAGLMSILTITRHTRAEEETGRQELLGAGVLGRRAPLTAAVILTLAADLILGVVIAVGSMVGGAGVTGSIVYGLGVATAGATFTGIAAITAQLSQSARTANGIAVTALGASYLLRAIGDAAGPHGPAWLSWVSPIGWTLNLHPYGQPRWWILALPIVATLICLTAAYLLTSRRDLGAGLLATRPGPEHAAATLASPFALALRLHRGLLLAWTIGFAIAGIALGSITGGIGSIINSSPQVAEGLQRLGGQTGLANAYLAAMLSLLGLVAVIYTVQATLRLRGEETGGRTEPLLATGTGRVGLAGSHLVIAFVGTALILLVGGVFTGIGAGLSLHDYAGQVPHEVLGAALQIPAAWTLAAVATLLIGALPRYAGLAWAAVVIVILIGELGPVFQLDHWAMDVSPFTHLPKIPGDTVTATPIVWLLVVTLVLTGLGLVGYRRRDLA